MIQGLPLVDGLLFDKWAKAFHETRIFVAMEVRSDDVLEKHGGERRHKEEKERGHSSVEVVVAGPEFFGFLEQVGKVQGAE